MAFIDENFEPGSVGYNTSFAPTQWQYKTTDTLTEVLTADYFITKAVFLNLDDLIYVSTGTSAEFIRITEVSPEVKTIPFTGSTDENLGFMNIPISFDATIFNTTVLFNFTAKIEGIALTVTKLIEASDNAEITLRHLLSAVNFTPSPALTLIANTPAGVPLETTPLAGFFTGDAIVSPALPLLVVPTKPTPGGSVLLQIFYSRVE